MSQVTQAKYAIALAIAYQLLLLLLIVLRPDLPVYSTTISEWAIGQYGWLMQIAFFSSGLSYLFLYGAIRKNISSKDGKAGLVLLFICFLGAMGVGTFKTDPYPPDMNIISTLIHTISGTLAMMLLPIAALLTTSNLAKNDIWATYKKQLKSIRFLPLIAFIGFIIHLNVYVIPLGENAVGEHVPIGYPPRLLFLSYHLWLIIVACITINTNKQQ